MIPALTADDQGVYDQGVQFILMGSTVQPFDFFLSDQPYSRRKQYIAIFWIRLTETGCGRPPW